MNGKIAKIIVLLIVLALIGWGISRMVQPKVADSSSAAAQLSE